MNTKNRVLFWVAAAFVSVAFICYAASVFASDCSSANFGVNAGSDMDVNAGEAVRLDGSACGGCGNSGVSWRCTGGSLSDSDTLRPEFKVPENDYNFDNNNDHVYTCTLSVNGGCGSNSDSVSIRVRNSASSKMRVALIADPKSTCAPARRVDLTATLYDYGTRNGDYTYYFDCNDDGSWDKIVTTDETSYTSEGLCDYSGIGSFTARVKVASRGRDVTDTDIVRATDCNGNDNEGNNFYNGQVSITKTVNDITKGTGFQGTVAANPGDTVAYRIVVAGISGNVNNVIVSDLIPNGIINVRDILVDGSMYGGNLATGINMGNFYNGQTKVITYTATVAAGYGQGTMTNTATLTVDGNTANSSAAVQTYQNYQSPVKGATAVSTGFSGGAAGAGLGFAGGAFCLGWLLFQVLQGGKMTSKDLLSRKISFIKKNRLA